MPIQKESFSSAVDGKGVDIFTLKNSHGIEARILNYGGIVVSLKAPDKNGKFEDVVLGYDHFEPYRENRGYLGALIGRYGNRIANGKFTLTGKTHTLAQNNGPNSLHGGLKGFDKVVWETNIKETKLGPGLELAYLSKDGEEGFPGNLRVAAVYTLTEENGLRVDFTATTDQPTICNLTQHSYFNLAGAGDILNHEVMIAADRFTPVDSKLIPTGELRPVKGTPFDFTKPMRIGARIETDDPQIQAGHGYDHNFVLNKKERELALAARVLEPLSGRVMEVLTTEPGMQFYSGNFLSDLPGKNGARYDKHGGFAMEPQVYPDSPNHPDFPSAVLSPGQTYQNTIIYRFTTQ